MCIAFPKGKPQSMKKDRTKGEGEIDKSREKWKQRNRGTDGREIDSDMGVGSETNGAQIQRDTQEVGSGVV